MKMTICASVAAAVLTACGGWAPPVAADAAPKPVAACDAAVHHQFDFWIGDWDVRDAQGKPAGRNRITRVHDGCGLLEQWSGAGNVTGSSLNAYDPARRAWHQTWIDNTGNVLVLEGEWQDGRMVLRGTAPLATGAAPALQRISWQPLPDGRVRQLWESSSDRGTTWSTVFDGYYTRRTDARAKDRS